MLINAEHSTLVLVDLQKKLMPVISGGEAVAGESVRLARVARCLGIPVVATEQIPEKLGHSLDDIAALADRTIAKTHFDACRDSLLEALPADRRQIVIGGCEAHVCVLQTALSLLATGYSVWMVENATGSRHDNDRDTALERLQKAGATLVTVEMAAFEWMQHCEHPGFREVQALIK